MALAGVAPGRSQDTRYSPGDEFPIVSLVEVKFSNTAPDQVGRATLQAESRASGSSSLVDRREYMLSFHKENNLLRFNLNWSVLIYTVSIAQCGVRPQQCVLYTAVVVLIHHLWSSLSTNCTLYLINK